MMMDQELISGFVIESRDLLDEVEPCLIELQQNSDAGGNLDRETLDKIFRLFHSMKGSAGFLGLDSVSSITHEAETLLDLVRKGKTTLTLSHTSLLCDTIDFMRELLEVIDETMSDQGREEGTAALVVRLEGAIKGDASPVDEAPAAAAAPKAKQAEEKAPVEQPAAEPAETQKGEDAPAPSLDLGEGDEAGLFDIPITDEMLEHFTRESDDLLDSGEQALLQAGNTPETLEENLAEAFRAIHSLKGNAGLMGLNDLQRLSHRVEEALQGMVDGVIVPDDGNLSVILNVFDVLRGGVADAATGEKGPIHGCDAIIELVGEMLPEGEEAPAAAPPKPKGKPSPQPTKPAAPPTPEPEAAKPPTAKASTTSPVAPEVDSQGDSAAAKAAESKSSAAKAVVRNDIRVDINKLDSLINLVGELVIAEAMVTRSDAVLDIEDENYERAVHQLRRVTSSLQDVAMSVRMIPLSATFRKMIRLVHDVSAKAGKQVDLKLLGEDTEVDKTVIEKIADPLVHIVRNSVDHGVEPSEERIQCGKPETGSLVIEGRHEGGEVWIIIRDDGRGLNRKKIVAKAIERGLIKGDGSDLTDSQVNKLIFEAGFSTADAITDISGRGVGMDVVKRNIENLNGRIDVNSKEGEGTTVILRIPLTLAIMEGMLVRVGDSRYTLPMLSIRESLRPDESSITRT
ncbi:MAG: chemotaxis protein CheA, partial [Planctomycetota bacterium]